MGILALVDYSLIKELCTKVHRDNRRFTGKLKIDPDENERAAAENNKIDAFKRVLLSDKSQSTKRTRPGKKPRSAKKPEKKRFKQSEQPDSASSASSDSSISNTTSENESEVSDTERGAAKPGTESK